MIRLPSALARLASAKRPFAMVQPFRGIQVTAFDLRVGDLIEYGDGNQLWKVASQQFSRQAQGRAFVQIELRALKSGIKKDIRMRTDEAVEKAAMDASKKAQVLYWDKSTVTAMEPTTFEQFEIPIGDGGLEESNINYLQEGIIVSIDSYKGVPVAVTLPTKIPFVVKEVSSHPSSSAKENRDIPAVLENGLKIKVPKFVKAGDKILLDTRDGSYAGKE
jgi:elongation factor P